MHIVLGLLGTIVTILWLLHRLAEMGIDLGGLNPWLWQRRRRWKKKYEANPIYGISSPMEATALLVAATAKADGDMSSEEKSEILKIFENEFHLSKREASGLLVSSTFLINKGDEVRDNLTRVLSQSINNFSSEQAESAIELVQRVADIGGGASETQSEFVQNATRLLEPLVQPKPKWD